MNWNTCLYHSKTLLVKQGTFLYHLYHSKTLLVKQGTFLYEVWPDSAEKRDILNTRNLDISGIGYGKFCSLMNC